VREAFKDQPLFSGDSLAVTVFTTKLLAGIDKRPVAHFGCTLGAIESIFKTIDPDREPRYPERRLSQ
jgi:hypothetical protein